MAQALPRKEIITASSRKQLQFMHKRFSRCVKNHWYKWSSTSGNLTLCLEPHAFLCFLSVTLRRLLSPSLHSSIPSFWDVKLMLLSFSSCNLLKEANFGSTVYECCLSIFCSCNYTCLSAPHYLHAHFMDYNNPALRWSIGNISKQEKTPSGQSFSWVLLKKKHWTWKKFIF